MEVGLEKSRLEQQKELLEKTAENQAETLSEPQPRTLLRKIEDGKVDAELQYWIKNPLEVEKTKTRILETFVSETRDLPVEEQNP
ncbi:MAG: hypothetical protein ABEJ93_00885 [Candidatus Nanohalobium sp.]